MTTTAITKRDLDPWRKRLEASHGKTVDGILEHGLVIANFHSVCMGGQGGTLFTQKMKQ